MIKKRWTEEENELLVQAVKDNFNNLTQAFNQVANTTNRTVKSVSGHWYAELSNPMSKQYIGSVCFIGFSEKKSNINRKNYIPNKSIIKPQGMIKSLWNKIIKLFIIK